MSGTSVVPVRRLIVEPEPDLIEGYGTPEFYIDGYIVRDEGGHCLIGIGYVDRWHCGHLERHEVFRTRIPREAHEASFAAERMRMLGHVGAH